MKRCFYLFVCIFLLNIAFCTSCSAKVIEYKLEVINTYTHDKSAYTQGIFFHNGIMYESTGEYGNSSIRQVSLESGEVLKQVKFSSKYFAEGSVVFNNQLYILTWTNKVVFVYDTDLNYIKSYSYPREGWGLTTDGQSLITSDGSSKIYFLDKNLKQERSINISYNGKALRNINELEWIDGRIWANVYLSDMIVIINPSTGEIEASIDCSNLLPNNLRDYDTDVLNGIAYNPDTKKIYLTGKNWPQLFEIKLVRK